MVEASNANYFGKTESCTVEIGYLVLVIFFVTTDCQFGSDIIVPMMDGCCLNCSWCIYGFHQIVHFGIDSDWAFLALVRIHNDHVRGSKPQSIYDY